jgi:hypothetical protein
MVQLHSIDKKTERVQEPLIIEEDTALKDQGYRGEETIRSNYASQVWAR